jgi:hypothetical protein
VPKKFTKKIYKNKFELRVKFAKIDIMKFNLLEIQKNSGCESKIRNYFSEKL